MKKKLAIILALVMILAISLPAYAADTAIASTMRLSSMEGSVSVKNASGKAVTARNDMRLYNGYSLSTGKDSCAYINLDDTKAVKLDALTTVTVKKNGKKLEVQVVSGSIFFNVTEPLKGDESLNIRTTTMVTGIRGTSGMASVKPAEIELNKDGRPESKKIWDEQVQLYTGHAEIVAKVSVPLDGANVSAEELDKPSSGTAQSEFENKEEKKQELESIFKPSGTTQAQAVETVVVIEAGETVVSRSLGVVADSEKYEVQKIEMTAEDIPSVALEEIVDDTELQEEIKEQAPQLICDEEGNIDTENLKAVLEETQTTEAEKLEEKEAVFEEETAKIETETVQDQVFKPTTEVEVAYEEPDPTPEPAPSSDNTTIELTGADEQTYLAALNTATATSITVKDSTLTLTSGNTASGSADIAEGKTVTLNNSTLNLNGVVSNVNGTMNVESGSTLNVNEDASLQIFSSNSVHVAGSLNVTGFIALGDEPHQDNGYANKKGLLEITSTGTLNWNSSGADSLSINYGDLIISGSADLGGKDLYISSGSSLTLNQGGSISNSNNYYVRGTMDTAGNLNSAALIETYGTLNFKAGAVNEISVQSCGAITINGGSVETVNSYGRATVNSGTIGTFNSYNDSYDDKTGHAELKGGSYEYIFCGSGMTISGTVNVARIQNNGDLVIDGASLKYNGDEQASYVILIDSPMTVKGSVSYEGNTPLFCSGGTQSVSFENGTSITGPYTNSENQQIFVDPYDSFIFSDNVDGTVTASFYDALSADQNSAYYMAQRVITATPENGKLTLVFGDDQYVQTLETYFVMVDMDNWFMQYFDIDPTESVVLSGNSCGITVSPKEVDGMTLSTDNIELYVKEGNTSSIESSYNDNLFVINGITSDVVVGLRVMDALTGLSASVDSVDALMIAASDDLQELKNITVTGNIILDDVSVSVPSYKSIKIGNGSSLTVSGGAFYSESSSNRDALRVESGGTLTYKNGAESKNTIKNSGNFYVDCDLGATLVNYSNAYIGYNITTADTVISGSAIENSGSLYVGNRVAFKLVVDGLTNYSSGTISIGNGSNVYVKSSNDFSDKSEKWSVLAELVEITSDISAYPIVSME